MIEKDGSSNATLKIVSYTPAPQNGNISLFGTQVFLRHESGILCFIGILRCFPFLVPSESFMNQ